MAEVNKFFVLEVLYAIEQGWNRPGGREGGGRKREGGREGGRKREGGRGRMRL